jgi:tetratricopeptide (TPR) repeat protein
MRARYRLARHGAPPPAARLPLSQQTKTARLARLDALSSAAERSASWTSAFVSQAHERYARAELLHQLGRDEEALHGYRTFDQTSPYDLVYLGPASYRQGQILEAHGRPAEAAAQYQRFVSLWHDCDPEFKRLTDDASRRLAALRPDSAHR